MDNRELVNKIAARMRYTCIETGINSLPEETVLIIYQFDEVDRDEMLGFKVFYGSFIGVQLGLPKDCKNKMKILKEWIDSEHFVEELIK